MARRNKEGRPLKRVLEWKLNRDVRDVEIAAVLGKPPATFSRRKEAEDFPSFEELEKIGENFGINPRWLQVEFGYLDVAEVDKDGRLRAAPVAETATKEKPKRQPRSKVGVRADTPPM